MAERGGGWGTGATISVVDNYYTPGGAVTNGFDIQTPSAVHEGGAAGTALSSDYTRADGVVFDGSKGAPPPPPRPLHPAPAPAPRPRRGGHAFSPYLYPPPPAPSPQLAAFKPSAFVLSLAAERFPLAAAQTCLCGA